MNIAIALVTLVTVVAAIAALARRCKVSAPLALTIAGILASFLPGVPEVHMRSEVVLFGLLPPLLYAAAIKTSLLDIRANRASIVYLSVVLVLASAFAVGALAWWLLGIPFAAGVALGAVVAPPDAVAATSIARRIGLPRRVVTLLEGESLLNDATALVALRTALAALAGAVSASAIFLDFARAAGGGFLLGAAVAWLGALIRRRVTDPVFDTSLSLLTPFVAYLAAESVHASGVLAVVVAGVLLAHKAAIIQSAASRVSERTNWVTIQFLLESVVFFMIGMQGRWIVANVTRSELSFREIAVFCGAVLAVVILVRPAFVYAAAAFLGLRGQEVSWGSVAIVSWAGMRGVVTLAAVFVLPEETPHRDILVLAAMSVTAGTLLLQGLTLPWAARRLGLRGPDPREDALQMASVLQGAVRKGIETLERSQQPGDDAKVVESLRARGQMRANVVWERLGRSGTGGETPSEQYVRLRTAMLAAERAEVLRVRRGQTIDHDILEEVMANLDIEESTLDRIEAHDREERKTELVTSARQAGACADLQAAPSAVVPLTPAGCPDCVAEGTKTVHLRLCLACGNVGCCDSSEARHADRHFHRSGHPVMRSFEPGEAWRWCYRHELLG